MKIRVCVFCVIVLIFHVPVSCIFVCLCLCFVCLFMLVFCVCVFVLVFCASVLSVCVCVLYVCVCAYVFVCVLLCVFVCACFLCVCWFLFVFVSCVSSFVVCVCQFVCVFVPFFINSNILKINICNTSNITDISQCAPPINFITSSAFLSHEVPWTDSDKNFLHFSRDYVVHVHPQFKIVCVSESLGYYQGTIYIIIIINKLQDLGYDRTSIFCIYQAYTYPIWCVLRG